MGSARAPSARRSSPMLEFITCYKNAFYLTRVHCATVYQSVLRHEQHDDVTTRRAVVLFCEDSSDKAQWLCFALIYL